ncbi:MAG: hypothetical protein A2020_13815 [Lentisphaerae bacterium GWF2_45_14]|nr:MAG: hypothetical protein A2020_13815 [Lentisphaerae bacterium GWF2_45_14]
MAALTGLEYKKLIRQKLHYTGLGVVLFFTCLSSLGFIMHRMRNAKKKIEGEAAAELLNGIAFSMTCLVPAIYVLFPMIISIFTATSMAGELQNGQMRTMLLRPVSRWNVFFSRFFMMSFYSFFLVIALLFVSYSCGSVMFGATGDVVIFGEIFLRNGSRYILPEKVVFTKLLLMYSFACFSTIYLVAMNMMISALTKKVSHTIVISLGIYYTSYILSSLSFMKHIHAFLPTRYLDIWRFAVVRDIPWDQLFHDCTIDICYIVSFLVIGGIAFNMTEV